MNQVSEPTCCRLCGEPGDLVDSHIVPQFVYDWMKRTGGYIRMAGSPNLRKQDGPKPKLLCQKCDNELFAVPEDYFSKTIFLPYLTDRANNVSYDKRLPYFLVSVLWRAWVANLSDMKAGDAGWDFRQRLKKAETQWRAFLLHGRSPS